MNRSVKGDRAPEPATEPAPPAALPLLPFAVSVMLSALFVAISLPVLGKLPHDFDEAWLVLDARFILRGLRPFVDFAHHEMPLHLYLLALVGKVFGQTMFGYRLLSLGSLAGSGYLLFALANPLVGPIPALTAQAVFLFSPIQERALTAVPETPTVFVTLLAIYWLFARTSRASAYASAIAFVVALLIKPTSLVVIAAAALSLVYARDWRRLRDLAVAGTLAAAAGLAWVVYASDGIFAEILSFQVSRIGTRSVGMWSIDSGFSDMRRLTGIDTPLKWAIACFRAFYHTPSEILPTLSFGLALLAIPLWVVRCVRTRPALQAFTVLWPASYLLLNFAVLDFASPRYFIPFPAFAAFLLGGWVWLLQQYVPLRAVAAMAAVAGVALVAQLTTTLGRNNDPWYWDRLDYIAREVPSMVSFSPILFAATGAEPGCGFANPALTYGSFGETFLLTERTRGFRFNDERLIACLQQHPEMPVIVDWAFYYFTRPGSALRAYLAGPGYGQLAFFSAEAAAQWDRPLLRMDPFR